MNDDTTKQARVEEWYLMGVNLTNDPHQAPEAVLQGCIYGKVYNHPNHADGHFVKTSRIVKLDLKNKTVQTLNRVYRLGLPNQEYIDWLRQNNWTAVLEAYGL